MLERDESIVVLRNVPAEVCENCDEAYFTAEVTDQVLALAEEAIRRGAVVEVARFVPPGNHA